MRLTYKDKENYYSVALRDRPSDPLFPITAFVLDEEWQKERNKLGQLEDIEEELGIDLITFLKGINPNTCFMEITKDKKFYFCGDAYYGDYSKEALLELIQNLLFMYWALTKQELK